MVQDRFPLGAQHRLRIGAVDKRELTFKALAGLIGGAIGWFPVELASHNHSLTDVQTTGMLIAGFLTMALMAGMIGGMIMAAAEQRIEFSEAASRHFLLGFVVCAVVSLPGTYYSDLLFSAVLSAGGWGSGQAGSEAYLVFGRLLGWTLMGLLLGVGVGIASFSIQNILKGGLGGLIGGFVGGLSFDLIGSVSHTGLMPRLVGFSVIGLAIGLFIGLVQELTKSAWIVVEAGRLRGRQFRLEGATINIGRAEENPIGLFGDPSISPRHAVIEHRGENYSIRNLAVEAGTFVNGGRIESAALREGDRIRIGGYELTFHSRADPRSAEPAAGAPPRAAAAAGAACLTRADGDRLFLKAGAPTRVGRALDNDIVIDDASISRYHAVIEARNGGYVVRDLGSHNGTWLGDTRVTQASLERGATIRLGNANFTFDA
ncbi:MAG TPA: FHA domain-containing protein [Candidatus Binataceae bacterium]|nr:FHA domain-containing protein [Candidatus Binataceae bacterium]